MNLGVRFGLLLLVISPVVGLLAGCGRSVSSGSGGAGGEGGAGGGGGAQAGGQHASCAAPAPEPLPELPAINSDPTGRPLFDHFRDLDCSEVSGYLCGAAGDSSGCPDGTASLCLQSDPSVGGVCTYLDSDIWCDGEGEAIGYGNGSCWMCAPIEARAAACCAGLAGFDCRAWPYPRDGKPGMLCARHEDCEPGLVCGANLGEGYGICQCPGLVANSVQPDPACGW